MVVQGDRRVTAARVTTLVEAISAVGDAEIVGLDMPIGLLDAAVRGGRDCDRAARKRLGPRASSVFSPPVRSALDATDYRRALALNRESSPEGVGISIFCFGIFKKLAEVDALMGARPSGPSQGSAPGTRIPGDVDGAAAIEAFSRRPRRAARAPGHERFPRDLFGGRQPAAGRHG
ncbi:MAG: DUF429 domain-containing protein [Candidatus Rokubacteria bacterium]|nr:DUF429 domain-containing protein [Candidatus Rokubacteria bacterium]